MNATITCQRCDMEYGPDSGNGWGFTNVPWNDMTAEIVRAHERRYGHTVTVQR